jgi:hypothetical protein
MEEHPPTPPAPRRAASLLVSALVAALACGSASYWWFASHPGDRAVVAAPPAPRPPVPARPRGADFRGTLAGADVHRVADWVVATSDQREKPFAVVDKRQAMVYVFEPSGQLQAASPVLLGLARGDDSEPGIGDKPMAAIRPDERTTPAGRFVAQPGKNLGGENVIWVDYDAAVSMHSVRANVKSERRLERLQSPDPAQHRISYGCINLPAEFFSKVAWPAFGSVGGTIYVLPETRPLAEVFPALRSVPATTAG